MRRSARGCNKQRHRSVYIRISGCYLCKAALLETRLPGTSAADIAGGQLRRLRCLQSDSRGSELTRYNRKGITGNVVSRYEDPHEPSPINLDATLS